MQTAKEAEFLIACLCAGWCGTCREYEDAFRALQDRFPAAGFVWIDVEDEADVVGDLDVENFPTIVIQRGADVLFCGPMLPQVRLLERLLETFVAQSEDESRTYARGTEERQAWQDVANLRARLPARPFSEPDL